MDVHKRLFSPDFPKRSFDDYELRSAAEQGEMLAVTYTYHEVNLASDLPSLTAESPSQVEAAAEMNDRFSALTAGNIPASYQTMQRSWGGDIAPRLYD